MRSGPVGLGADKGFEISERDGAVIVEQSGDDDLCCAP